MKLDVVGNATATLDHVLNQIKLGHADSLARTLHPNHSAPFSFTSVYYNQEQDGSDYWKPSYRYTVQSYSRMHQTLFRQDVPVMWKNLYEIIPHDRARNLYFDIEQNRPTKMSVPQHDMECWEKTQLLKEMVIDVFRCLQLQVHV